jgi:hypothetical protein
VYGSVNPANGHYLNVEGSAVRIHPKDSTFANPDAEEVLLL